MRKNLMMEEVVEAYINFRANLVQFVETERSNPPRSGRKRSRKDSTASTSDIEDSEVGGIPEERSPKRTSARSARVTRSSAIRSQASQEEQILSDLLPGHVHCPVCQRAIHQDKIESHVNRCLEGKATPPPKSPAQATTPTTAGTKSIYFEGTKLQPGSSRTSIHARSATPPSLTRLAKVSYAAVSEPKLRKILADFGINTNGSRNQLERRCTEYITMWNSNLDSKAPRSKRELLADMRAWDKVQAKPVVKLSNEEIDNANEKGRYDSDFGDLIAKARESMKKRKAAEVEQSRPGSVEKEQEQETDQHQSK